MHSQQFSDYDFSIPQEIRAEIDKWDYIKLKSFSTTKKIIIIMMTTYRMGENL
jgi:hypothetical protein